MSTPNFWTQGDFPLYVKDDRDFTIRRCPECDCWMNAGDEDTCPECGAELEQGEEFDQCEAEYFFKELQKELDKVNSGLRFYRITLESGYYAHTQFYVELSEAADSAGFGNLNDRDDRWKPDNESCRYYLDMCRSEAFRKFGTETRKVNKILKKLAEDYGFIKLNCLGVFSNGEAIYQRA